jgi:hypothetical protein
VTAMALRPEMAGASLAAWALSQAGE